MVVLENGMAYLPQELEAGEMQETGELYRLSYATGKTVIKI